MLLPQGDPSPGLPQVGRERRPDPTFFLIYYYHFLFIATFLLASNFFTWIWIPYIGSSPLDDTLGITSGLAHLIR